MKKTFLIQGVLLLFLSFQFYSCSDEPLEGEFVEVEEPNGVGEGQFKATVSGEEFIAEVTTGLLSSTNKLMIGGNKVNGKSINLAVENPEVGEFSLNSDSESQNAAAYRDGNGGSLPYTTSVEGGGSGQMKITKMDTVTKTVSGTFFFTGVRTKLDGSGNPVLDGDGVPVMEKIEVTNGVFNAIEYTKEGSGGL